MLSPLLVLGALSLVLGCDKRTPEEKARDYANKKLGFVQGANEELAKRGEGIGEGRLRVRSRMAPTSREAN
jgi:hypothetical protein